MVLGVFSNLTYLIGFLLSLGIWSTAEGFGGPYMPGQSTDIGTAFPYALLFVIMFAISAGCYYGLDGWLTPLLGRRGFLATGFSSNLGKQSTNELTGPRLQHVPSTRKLQLEPEYPLYHPKSRLSPPMISLTNKTRMSSVQALVPPGLQFNSRWSLRTWTSSAHQTPDFLLEHYDEQDEDELIQFSYQQAPISTAFGAWSTPLSHKILTFSSEHYDEQDEDELSSSSLRINKVTRTVL